MKLVTLRKQKDFDTVFSSKQSFGNRHFTLLYCSNHLSVNRVGIIISKKFSKKAVCRNKMRRQIKYLFEQNRNRIKSGYDLVILPKKRCLEDPYSIVSASFIHLFYKKDLLNEKQNI